MNSFDNIVSDICSAMKVIFIKFGKTSHSANCPFDETSFRETSMLSCRVFLHVKFSQMLIESTFLHMNKHQSHRQSHFPAQKPSFNHETHSPKRPMVSTRVPKCIQSINIWPTKSKSTFFLKNTGEIR